MSNMIENQLINKKNNIQHYEDISEMFIDLTPFNIQKFYKEVYVLVKKNNEPIPVEFYNLNVDENIYKQVLSNLIIYKVSISLILKNIKNYNNIIMLSNNDLQQFNIFNYTLGIKNIILPILNINFSDLSIYLDQYRLSNTIDNIYKLKLMNNYLDSNTTVTSDYVCNMIDEMTESKYWTLSSNCEASLNYLFKRRQIFFDTCRLSNKVIVDKLNFIFKSKTKFLSEKEDYIKDIETKNSYIDIGSLNNYSIDDKPEMSYDNFNQLFKSLSEKEQFLLFTNCMVSKKYVHLVINNKYILDIMLPRMRPMLYFFKYLLSYSWIMFYYEECIKKTHAKTSDTFIFDLETASRLPVFPFLLNKPKENPYMPILVSDKELLSHNNIGGIGEYDTNDPLYKNGGICNLKEFITRINIFCTGDAVCNLFEDFDFKKYNVAISGSIMTACLQRNHPLMNIFINQNNKLEEYFNEFYSESDIDVMFIAKDTKTFITHVNVFYNQICTNILKIFNPLPTNNNTKLILNKIGYLFVSEEFIIKHIEKEPSKIKWIKNNINSDEVINMFKPFYEELKEQKYKELVNGLSEGEIKKCEEEFPDIYKTLDVEYKIYINNKTCKNIDLVYTYKYKITSSYLKHPFELFKIKYDDFISSVSQFHLPCVRAYYNGNVYLTPSCISSHLTYMNLDYKYVSGCTDILEIINKYRIRGFGTWLNINEVSMMNKYNKEIFQNKNKLIDFHYGGNISLFGEPILYKSNNKKYKLLDTLKLYDQKLSYMEILKDNIITDNIYKSLCVINSNGNIVPLKKWIINFTWDLIKN